MLWGVGVVAIVGGVAWFFKTPGSAPLGRAFGVLLFYGVLFWLTLLKIWWTAGKAAVVVEETCFEKSLQERAVAAPLAVVEEEGAWRYDGTVVLSDEDEDDDAADVAIGHDGDDDGRNDAEATDLMNDE